MEFTASSGGDGGSYEKPKPGIYFGVLIGVADLGTQDGGAFGPKRKILLRWELHKRKGPVLDSEGHILTILARYNQSFADKSALRPVIEAHIGKVRDGDRTGPKQWLGKAARLTLEETADKKYINVASVSRLDPEEDPTPAQQEPTVFWVMADAGVMPPPPWAKVAVEKSAEWRAMHPEHESQDPPPRGGGGHARATAGVGAGAAAEDDDDIPF